MKMCLSVKLFTLTYYLLVHFAKTFDVITLLKSRFICIICNFSYLFSLIIFACTTLYNTRCLQKNYSPKKPELVLEWGKSTAVVINYCTTCS